MFKSKKFKLAYWAEMLPPWLVLVIGIPAIYYFDVCYDTYNNGHPGEEYYHADKMFDLFYHLSMVTGGFVLALEIVAGIIAFVWLICNLVKRDKPRYSIARPLVLWLCPGLCVFGTLFLMLVVNTLTYGMSV